MPKLYYPSPDELCGATPLNGEEWFRRYKVPLLSLPNTNEGRDLLCLDSWQKRPYPIIALEKNRACYYVGKTADGKYSSISDGRVGAKWANVIRSRWQEFVKAMDHQLALDIQAWPSVYDSKGRVLLPIGAGTTTTKYPDAGSGNTTVDGFCTESTAATWGTMRGAAGDAADDTSVVIRMINKTTTTTNQYEIFRRIIITFDFSGVADGDTKDSATLEYAVSTSVEDLGASSITVVVSAPANNNAVVAGDYDSLLGTKQCADKAITTLTVDSSTYNSQAFDATGLGNISLSAVSPLGMLILRDFANSEYSWSSDKANSQALIGADTSGTTADPKIVLIHSTPFTPKVMMF